MTSNERGQETTLKAFQNIPMREGSNAVVGCGGIFILNLTAVLDIPPNKLPDFKIQVFDISLRVEEFWQKMEAVIAQMNPRKLHASQTALLNFVNDCYKKDRELLVSDIKSELSFVSSYDRLRRICTIFKAGNFSFTRLDFGNPHHVKKFVDRQKAEGVIPHAYYLSEMAHLPANLHFNRHFLTQRYIDFKNSFTQLHAHAITIWAQRNNHDDLPTLKLKLTCKKAFDELLPPLCDCFFEGCEPADIKKLIENQINLNRKAVKHQKTDDPRYTYLQEAISTGDVGIVTALLDGKAEINPKSLHHKKNAFFSAVAVNQALPTGLVELLLAYKADIHMRDTYGSTSLHLAASLGHEVTVSTLLQKKANPLLINFFGETPLQAIENGKKHFQAVEQLLMEAEQNKLLQLLQNLTRPFNEENEEYKENESDAPSDSLLPSAETAELDSIDEF